MLWRGTPNKGSEKERGLEGGQKGGNGEGHQLDGLSGERGKLRSRKGGMTGERRRERGQAERDELQDSRNEEELPLCLWCRNQAEQGPR